MMRRWPCIRVLMLVTVLVTGGALWARDGRPRLVVLGFDGADARMVQKWMQEGRLPHLAELARRGSFHPLLPTNPAQTPVSWSSMATGLSPGRTQIFDFLKRSPGSYYPEFALLTEEEHPFLAGRWNPLVMGGLFGILAFAGVIFLLRRRRVARWVAALTLGLVLGGVSGALVYRWVPENMPTPHNNRHGTPFWVLAARAGLRVKVLRYPTSFPVDPIPKGHMLSGLGVPDIRGTIGQPTIYTDDASLLARANEFSLKIELVDTLNMGEAIDTVVWGPWNKLYCDTRRPQCRAWLQQRSLPLQFQDRLRLWLDLEQRTVRIAYRGQRAQLREGEWSDWFVFRFPLTPLVRITAIGRFYLIQTEPFLMLYLSPLHFHPEMAARIPFAWPRDWARELAESVGLFKTMGWAIDTWTITSGLAEEPHFLSDVKNTVQTYRAIMNRELARDDWDLFVMVYSFTDRVQHILWRLIDDRHPLYDPRKAQYYGAEIARAYETMDAIVGDVMEKLPPDARLIVVSDHGFSSWRRQINFNTWLVEHGFMKLKGQVAGLKTLSDLFAGGNFFEQVDWSRTKAYAIGLGPIYINLKGREPQGIVEPGAEYEAVRKAIIAGLENVVDPETGEKPVYRVYTREEMYGSGFDPDVVPDLRVANRLGYRVSWQTTLGNVAPTVFEDNLKNWSADHCSVEPSLIPGILFTSWPLTADRPRIVDLMPTILDLLGVPVPADLDGHSLLPDTSP